MTPDRWPQVESLFHAALACEPSAREAFLAEACQGDEDLRGHVVALLAHDHADGSFIETPALHVAARRLAREGGEAEIPTLSRGNHDSADTPGGSIGAADALVPGRLLGNYRIVRKIGEGGMGEVYLAEDLKLGRRVALKLLPLGMAPDARARRRLLREAQAASSLNHPHIVTIYTIEEVEGMNLIVMEYIEGESLRERLLRGPMNLAEATTLGIQVADAIGAAHAINIVHRDLKPGNILITLAGQAKIVDFGLAKGAGGNGAAAERGPGVPGISLESLSVSFSQAGSLSGTVPYMSPEQTRGEHLDGRSDIFSLGCVLYEATTSRRPFRGETVPDLIRDIREADPRPPGSLRPGLPREFNRIVLQSLAKDKEQRYATAQQLSSALRRLHTSQSVKRVVKRLRTPVAIALVALVALLSWRYWRESRLRSATDKVARLPDLAKAEQFFEAYDLVQEVEEILPADTTLEKWRPYVTDSLSLTTDPSGAAVYLRRFQRDESGELRPREFIGVTPIKNREIARGEYLLAIEKEGYVPILRTLSNEFHRMERGLWVPDKVRMADLVKTSDGTYDMIVDSDAPIELDITLLPLGTVPERMVHVPGGQYQMAGGDRDTNEFVELDDFFIDKFEVTNREYKEFVDAGGYENPAFWKHAFVQVSYVVKDEKEQEDSKELPWVDGIALLVDRSGRPGPRSWTNQRYPLDKDDHPVTDVTWYEAAAYAEFRGKSLPTVCQWEKAARDGQSTVYWGSVMPWGMVGLNPKMEDRANFYASGTMPAESFEFGASPYGCYHMAGNVWEWCLNAKGSGFTATGASYHEGPNLFAAFGQFPGLYSAPTLGFRCVKNAPGASGDQGGMALKAEEDVPEYVSVAPAVFELLRTHYEYDPKPLDVKVIEDEEVETPYWTRTKISYIGAAGQRTDGLVPENKRVLAYLWLPKNAPRPLQVINYKPGGASYAGLTAPQETEVVCGPFILAGRAVFVVVIEGMRERDLPPDWKFPDEGTVAYRDAIVQDTIDQRRGLDYLATRNDVDMNKIVCMGLSAGGYDLVTMAVEKRFQGFFLLAAGLGLGGKKEQKMAAEANPVNFAPYISGPKLMIQGRYDESIPLKTSAEPLFALLTEPKKLIVLETGHFPPLDQWVPPAQKWMDETLGPVGAP